MFKAPWHRADGGGGASPRTVKPSARSIAVAISAVLAWSTSWTLNPKESDALKILLHAVKSKTGVRKIFMHNYDKEDQLSQRYCWLIPLGLISGRIWM